MNSHRLFMYSRQVVAFLVVMVAVGVFDSPSEAKKIMLPRRYHFKIEPATPVKELLPTPPLTLPNLPGILNEDLARVPELTIGEPVEKGPNTERETAHVVAKINHLNQKDPDGFLKALLANRPDLRGLPFIMGKECREDMKQSQLFAEVVRIVHGVQAPPALAELEPAEKTQGDGPRTHKFFAEEPDAVRYWKELQELLAKTDVEGSSLRVKSPRDDVRRAKVAAIVQMFAPASESYRVALAGRLAAIQHIDATRALAKLALYAPEESVRTAAIKGLQKRSAEEYKDILMQGFRYPLPAVAKRAAEALVKLERKDALPDLVKILEQPDPRAPAKAKIDGKEETVVRELVRVNHHRNCLLCHAPGNTPDVPRDVLRAPVTLPDQAIASFSEGGGYGFGSSPDIFVRVDVTYLRQDFSMMMPVENAKPWPAMQRFDFFVRTRVVTAKEAADCETLLARQTPPNRAAAEYALRELAGRAPTESTPLAWRRLLGL